MTTADDGSLTAAVDAAHSAGPHWRRLPPAERAAALRRAAAAVREQAEPLARLLTSETGRLLGQAQESATVAADLLEEAATTGLGATGRTLAGASAALDAVRREPRGVVAVITPWNDPFPTAAGLIAAALITGNTVVHKPSERCSEAGREFATLIADALPSGVLQVRTGDGAVGAELVADPHVVLVAHVGSTRAGRSIAATVGARGGAVLLENGGKDALVVDAGVDPQWAAEQIALGAFTNSGQICTAVERVYLVQESADAVVDALVALTQQLRVGDPHDPDTEIGPLVDEDQLGIVDAHVRPAIAAGAKCLTGGRRLQLSGAFYPPTVLDHCPPETEILTEETFGPVAPIVRVSDFDTALAQANTSRYGLAATVLTEDLTHALRAVEELEVGTVKINGVFGGAPGGSADPRRDSGGGAGYGPDLLAEMTVLKTVHLEAGSHSPLP